MAVLAVLAACHRPSAQVPVSTHLPPTEPAALESWLQSQEAVWPDVVPGAERAVVWANPEARARTELSVVYLHGFSATRQEVSPLCEEVGQELGANVYLPRLTGHGRSDDAMAEASLEDWKRDAQEAWAVGRSLGDRVLLVGTSTGATLAAWLASTVPQEQLAGVVYMSPNFGPKASGSRMLLMPGRRALLKMVVGETREWEPANELQREYWTWRYPSEALFPMMELVRLVELTDLSVITAPTLMIYSPSDQVVDAELSLQRFEEMGGQPKAKVVVESSGDGSNHILAGRIMDPEGTPLRRDEILRFLDDSRK